MAMDSAAVQSMQWWWLLYPQLAVSLAILLPCSALACWLKRNVRFDFPTAAPADGRAGPSSMAGMNLKAA